MTEIAYGQLYFPTRTQTAPMSSNTAGGAGAGNHYDTRKMNHASTGQNSLVHSQGHTSSNYSIQSQPSSRSSDTTQGTAHSTLFPPPPPMPSNAGVVAGQQQGNGGGNGGDVTATDNVMNTVADQSSSLFHTCVSLRQRLHGVPGFSESLEEEEEDADEDTDPVTLLWRTFRRGYPLMLLYNALRPHQPLELSASVREDKRGKAATFKFLQACINDLKFLQEEMFIITDLYGDDTTGFVKVAKVVNRVLDILVSRNLISDIRPTKDDFEEADKSLKKSQRQHIIGELVTTERTYVQHLELLQSFKHLVEEKGIIPGDSIHHIFLNLNSLLDFQRRFLIRVEQTNAVPEAEQNWGKLFVLYGPAFKVYEPYIANQKKCEKTVVANFPAFAAGTVGASLEIRQICESPSHLYGFLMKPFQRLSKYPLLLNDLYLKGDLDEDRRNDLLVGKEAASGVLSRTNQAVDREEKAEAVQELKMRVEDWKGHRVEGFGELLLYGTFTVLKSEAGLNGGGKEGERQYHVYLFETILLCCKDIDLSKPKNKLSNKQLVDKRGKPKLQLKGRIFMQNVTDLISLAKPGMPADIAFLKVRSSERIFWKGDPSIENFIIRFASEEMMKKWAVQIETQRRKYRDRSGRVSDGSRRGPYGSGGGIGGPHGGTSVTEFEFMRGMAPMENPYARMNEEEEDEEEGDDVETLVASQQGGYPYKMGSDFGHGSRNGSSTSLRSRSTTGESGMGFGPGSGGRAQPPRMASGTMQQPSLALRTRELHSGSSPGGDFVGDSYFSPVEGSPSATPQSSRTSASSGMYPFPRAAAAVNGYYEEGHGHGTRFTAPAIARQREPSVPNGGYSPQGPAGAQQAGRGPPPRPGLGMHSAQQMPGQPRNRSASSPDIHNNPRPAPGAMRGTGPTSGVMSSVPQGQEPPVPEMPSSYQQNFSHMAAPRSQTGSPNLPNGMPIPQRGVSPQMQRGYTTQQPQQLQVQHQQQMSGRGMYPGTIAERTSTPVNRDPAFSPPPPANLQHNLTAPADLMMEQPTQLKVKVHCPAASQTLTLVVPLNISYQSLKDRIDAKLQRSTNLTLSERGSREGLVKLKYSDEGDFVSIQSDEDVLTAFETWREQMGDGATGGPQGQMGEVELWCK